jgi:sec-independent protein translocase protein TatC
MPFLDHLEELRWRILWSLLALIVGTMLGFILVFSVDVIGFLKQPVNPYLEDGDLKFLAITDPFFITIKLAVAVGVIVAAPLVVYQVWAFLSPALMPRERRAIVPAFFLGLVLFVVGASMAYFLALPLSIRFLLGLHEGSLTPLLTAGPYFGFVTSLLLLFGFVFELPVVVLVLAAVGIVTSQFLRSKRRYAIAGMAILSAVISPGDVITVTVLLMVPLVALYEVSILLARMVERGRERTAQAEAEAEARAEAEQGNPAGA